MAHTICLYDVHVQDLNAATGNGAHGELLMAGDAEFAHQKNVQWNGKGRSHFEADRNAAARQREYDHVAPAGVSLQEAGKVTACVAAIEIRLHTSIFPPHR
jgi:hypothetical protein